MARETTPPRTLKTQIERVRDTAETGEQRSGQRVTFERVDAVLPGNKASVLGVVIPITGDGSNVKANQRVPVVWKGGAPQAVIDHHAQGAQFLPPLGGAAGIVEELYIAESDGSQDIWFRNATTNVSLGMRKPNGDGVTFLTADPREVFWGVNPDVFAVKTATGKYSVFRLKRTAKDKIIASGTNVKEKLYDVDLNTIEVDLVTIMLHLFRSSVESYADLTWHPANVGSPNATFEFDASSLVRDASTNTNEAEVTRQVTLRLKGIDEILFTNGVPIAASEIVVPAGSGSIVSPALQGVMIDDGDELVYNVRVTFDNWGMWQGNSTSGLTGSYHRLGAGDLTNVGICFVLDCPHEVDDVGVQDFMGHGNPSGVIATAISETHSVTIRARTGELIASTFPVGLKTIDIEEKAEGVDPYRIVHCESMPVFTPQCYAPNNFGPGGWRTVPCGDPPFPSFPDQIYGNVGDVGLVKSERSLFSSSLPYAPDLPSGNDPTSAAPTRAATIRVEVFNSGYDCEWPDGFGQVCGAFSAVPGNVHGFWSAFSVGVFDRYRVHVRSFPFWSVNGQPYNFISVLREARKPVGYTLDKSQVGAFVQIGNGAAFTLMPYTDIDSDAPKAPEFMSGNGKRVLWRQDTRWFLSDFEGRNKEVGSNADADDAKELVLTENDFLYSTKESRLYFVMGWDRATKAITLDQNAEDFPPREAALAQVQSLKKTSNEVGGIALGHYGSWLTGTDGKRSYHTIMDKQLLPGAFKNL